MNAHQTLLALAVSFAEAENHALNQLRECDCQIKGRYVEGDDDDEDEEDGAEEAAEGFVGTISEAESQQNLNLLYDVAADYITSDEDSVLADVFAAYYNQTSEEHMFAVAKSINAIKKATFEAALKIAGVKKEEHQVAQHLKDGLFALSRQVTLDIMLDDGDDETPTPVAPLGLGESSGKTITDADIERFRQEAAAAGDKAAAKASRKTIMGYIRAARAAGD